MGVPPELKYEAEGGPGTERSLDLIGRITARPAADRLTFIRMLIFHFLVGNADAHAKNYALLYRGRIPDLAPLYDVICTAAYPRLAKKLAMAIGGRSIPDTIQVQHWLTLIPQSRSAQRLLLNDLVNMASRIGEEADGLIVELAGEGVTHAVLKSIRVIINTRVAHLLRIADKC